MRSFSQMFFAMIGNYRAFFAHEPFAQLLEDEHREREREHGKPRCEWNRRSPKECVARGRVVDEQDDGDFNRDAEEDKPVVKRVDL